MSNGPYMAIEPLSKYFGVSVSTVRQWVRDERIPTSTYIQIGTTYRFHLRAVEDALINYKKREKLTSAERDEIAENLIRGLEETVLSDVPPNIPEDKLDAAEAELEAKVRNVPNLKDDPELDAELQEILDDEELQDL